MTTILIGYARCSTDRQDLAAQRAALEALGVQSERIYTDHGLTGTNRSRPGLDQALAAARAGDTLVVPKLDRLARSVPDARGIADALVARGVRLALGASVYDPADSMGKMFFNVLATFAEFESDLIARVPAKAWRSLGPAEGSAASSRNCPPPSAGSCFACMAPANTRSPTWRSFSRCPVRLSIEPWRAGSGTHAEELAARPFAS